MNFSTLDQSSTQRAFAIEGNIGCGKSTFLNIVKKYFPELELIEEPVDEWQNLAGKGVNMLERYYKDSKRWGLTFLNLAAFTRVRRFMAKSENTENYTLSERSILSDKHIFGPLMSDLGFIDEAEYILFQQMYKGYEQMLNNSLPKVIYLQCSPQVCSERTKKRQRTEQQSIPFSYFEKLHDLHQTWRREDNGQNMLVINTNDEFESDPERIDDMVEKLSLFIYGKKPSSSKTLESESLQKQYIKQVTVNMKESSEDQ